MKFKDYRLWAFLTTQLLATPPPTDWMKDVPDAAPLVSLSIPGSHDSGALFEPLSGTAKCQSLAIGAQLAAGVRFLDIRCRHMKDSFFIYHGTVDQKLGFDQVMDAVSGFLKDHPKECILFSIKEEHKAVENTRSFEDTYDHYVAKEPNRWWLGTDLTKLEQVRGKMVLFRRFGVKAKPKGINAATWKDNSVFVTGALKVQDVYQAASADVKWRGIKELLDESARGTSDTLYVNFTSATGSSFGIPNIPSISKFINPRLASYLETNPRGRYGILVMDFATEDLCRKIYESNFGAR